MDKRIYLGILSGERISKIRSARHFSAILSYFDEVVPFVQGDTAYRAQIYNIFSDI